MLKPIVSIRHLSEAFQYSAVYFLITLQFIKLSSLLIQQLPSSRCLKNNFKVVIDSIRLIQAGTLLLFTHFATANLPLPHRSVTSQQTTASTASAASTGSLGHFLNSSSSIPPPTTTTPPTSTTYIMTETNMDGLVFGSTGRLATDSYSVLSDGTLFPTAKTFCDGSEVALIPLQPCSNPWILKYRIMTLSLLPTRGVHWLLTTMTARIQCIAPVPVQGQSPQALLVLS